MAKFGKFEVGAMLGQGGFGRVFQGYDPVLKREVAIKTCTLTDPAMRKRFLREAEIAAGLRHPNIVVIHDLGEHEGEPYIVQEYLPGEDLDAVIHRQDPLPLEVKLRFLMQIADALGYAHSKGIIHRDIKPKNIRVLTSGDIRVLDFGIAKRSFDDTGTVLTQAGVGMGTVGYISPEQLRGDKVDHRTDIFSYGALAFEALSGKKPFDADTMHSVLYKIVNEEPVWPAELPEEIPAGLRALVDRCMAKRPEDRPQTGGEIARSLAGFLAAAASGVLERETNAGTQDDGTRVWSGDPAPVASGATPATPVAIAQPVTKPNNTRKAAIAAAAVIVLAGFGWYASSVAGDRTSDQVVAQPLVADSLTTPSDSAVATPGSQAAPIPQPSTQAPASTSAAAPVKLAPGSVLLALNLEDSGSLAGGAAVSRAAAQSVSRVFEKAGYNVAATTGRNAQTVAQAAKRGGAATAIIGQLTITDVVDKNEFGMASAFAMITLQAVDAATGREVSSSSQQIAGAGTTGSMAAANAAQRVAEKAAAELLAGMPSRN